MVSREALDYAADRAHHHLRRQAKPLPRLIISQAVQLAEAKPAVGEALLGDPGARFVRALDRRPQNAGLLTVSLELHWSYQTYVRHEKKCEQSVGWSERPALRGVSSRPPC